MAINGINSYNPYWQNSTYVQNQKAQQEAKSVVPVAVSRRDSYSFFDYDTETAAADTATLEYFKTKSEDYEVTTEENGDSMQKILDLLRNRRGKSFILIDPKF